LIERFDGLFAPVNLYWITWDGTLEWYNLALIVIYLAFIAIGIGAAWARHKWIGLVPLAFNIGYALANGISRFSSWRYNLPVDWIVYFYFGIGALEIVLRISQLFGAHNAGSAEVVSEDPARKPLVSKSKHVLIVAAFVLAGSLPWLAKGLARPRYTATPEALRQQALLQGIEPESLNGFLSQPGSVILEGRILYPRFFLRNDGIFSANPWPIYKVQDFARLGFLVLNALSSRRTSPCSCHRVRTPSSSAVSKKISSRRDGWSSPNRVKRSRSKRPMCPAHHNACLLPCVASPPDY
jgi:hypothetical protein